MRRRLRLMLRVTVALVLTLGVGAVLTATLLLRSARGRAWTAARVEAMLAESLAPGVTLRLHGLRLVPLGTLTLDSVVLRDRDGAQVLRTARIDAAVGLRPLLDREVHLTRLAIDGLEVDLAQDRSGAWNLESLAAPDSGGAASTPQALPAPWRIRLDTLTLRDGRVAVTQPDSLPTLPLRRRRFDALSLDLGPSVLHTDGPRGSVQIAAASLRSEEPALALALQGGGASFTADSAELQLPRILVGESRLALRASAQWRDSTRDPRLDGRLEASEIALADFAWVDSLIPRNGRATARVRVVNGRRDGEYRGIVERFTLVSGDSRIEGRLVAESGAQMAIRDIDVTLAPLDFALLRELFGDSTPPPPFDGQLRGRIRGDDFALAPSTLEFEDRRIGGAISRVTLDGRLDLEAAETLLKPLNLHIDSLDVRSVGAVTDIADSLRGFLRGRVTLEGPVVDLNFRDLELVHVDGVLPRSRILGSGRYAEDTATTWLEADLTLDTVALAALGEAVVGERLRGVLRGQLRTAARGDSVALDLRLEGEGATMHFVGATSMDTARLVARGPLRLERFDANRFLVTQSLPEHSIDGELQLGIDGGWEEPSGTIGLRLDGSSTLATLPLREGIAALVLEPGGLRVDTLRLALDAGEVTARGRLARDPALRDSLRFAATLTNVPTLAPLLGDSLAAAWADSLGGSLRIEGLALGSLDTMAVRATLHGDSLRAGSFGIRTMDGELLLDGVPRATQGLVTFDLSDAVAGTSAIHRLSAEATVRSPSWVDASFRMVALDTLFAQGRADINYMGDSLELKLDSLTATSRDADWRLVRPSRVFRSADRLEVDSLLLLSRDGARFALGARLDSAGPVTLRAQALRVPLRHARFTGAIPPRIDGLLTGDATLGGTLAEPTLALQMRLDSTRVEDREAPELTLDARYADRRADLRIDTRMLQRDAIALVAELPLDLSLEAMPLDERLLERPLYLRLTANGTPLAGFEALTTGLTELQGGLDADVQVTGTWRSIEPRGILLVRDGAFVVPTLGTGFRDLLMDVSLAPDSVFIQRARLADERSENDTASLEGAFVRTDAGWRADLRTVARTLRVIDDPRIAEADVSWQLRMRGPLDSLSLAGDVTVPQANIFIGRQRRRALELAEDRVAEETASQFAPRLEGVRLRLGNEVRLRSPEANVQLTGEVAAAGTLDEPDVRGEILATRGTFRLDLGLLQRTFQVDSGLVRLNGPLSIPPTLDIHTSYTVRQASREDVRIGARLTGSVESPRLILSSGDLGTTASETEIISYLLFGAPTFVLDGQSASAVRLATAALVPSLGGAAERALGARLPFLSELQVVTVAGDSPRDFTLNSFEGLLNSFALTAGTQVGTDSYLRLSGGVCRGENRAAQSLPAWFGIAAEYRPRERLSAELSLTPGSAPCNRIGSFAQIYQLGLDLYRDWRW
ncbi:MAG TPA: translocation/assembly module TamB domain-containing protein [Gemmatimonadaceae bacterium]|nr:translocation/assembly module TamB domain-containing protein [Gemmatimonadaceae bacterium]